MSKQEGGGVETQGGRRGVMARGGVREGGREGEAGWRGYLFDSLSPSAVSVCIVADAYLTDQPLFVHTNICVYACVVTL